MTKPAISVNKISKSFRIPLDGSMGVKQKLLNLFNKSKGYRDFTPLNQISFTIEKGEFFGIVGRNGSGKSTLLKTMAGIYSPEHGSVTVNGLLVPFIELGVGFNPELTGRENVYLNGALLGFSRNEIAAMYEEIVDFAELHDFMEERLKNYSSGMQVRLAFSIAIRAQGDILLLDEVLAVGDSAFQQKCFDYFEKLKREHRTIVLVTHSMDAVKRFCSRALLLEGGKIKLIGSPEEIADQYLLDNIASTDQEKKARKTKPSDTEKFTDSVSKLVLNRKSHGSVSRSDVLQLEILYQTEKNFNPAIAFTILKDGRSVAEMNSIKEELPSEVKKTHKVVFTTPLESFNPGVYQIDIALIDQESRALLAYKLKTDEFVIRGMDETRGGAIYLNGMWKAEH